MLANISANCKVEPTKKFSPTSSQYIKGIFIKFEKDNIVKTAKSSVKEKQRQVQAPPFACPCLYQRAESESPDFIGAVSRTEGNREIIAKAAGLRRRRTAAEGGKRRRERRRRCRLDKGSRCKGDAIARCPATVYASKCEPACLR